jgi:outer membrane protein TolC
VSQAKRVVNLVFVGLWAVTGMANPAVVTPDEVVRLTLAHSPSLKAQDESIAAASARRQQADAGLMPQLDARAQALHFEGLENQALGPVSIPVIENQFSASIGITQPLYTGGRVTSRKQSAKLAEESSRHARTATSSDLALRAVTAYWQWSKSLARIDALQASVDRMQSLAADTRNLEKAGMATDNDRLSVDVALDQTRLELDDAQRLASLSLVELSTLTGREFSTNEVPRKPALQPADMAVPLLPESLAKPYKQRAELISMRLNAQASEALVKAVRADRRPQLSLIARVEEGRPNQRDFPPDDQWRENALVGATLSWNLFDGGLTRARSAEARAKATRESLQSQALEEALVAEVRMAHLSLQHALKRLPTAQRAEDGARRNLEVATDLWKNGSARHSDVLEAQSRLTLTTSQRISAEADVLIGQAALKHATGDSL